MGDSDNYSICLNKMTTTCNKESKEPDYGEDEKSDKVGEEKK
jgi:hypothetical protein